MIHGAHGGHGFFFKISACACIHFRVLRVLRGFLVAYGKKSLEEIFNKIWPMARNNLSFSLHKYNL